jgi:co-chaperonin GroES (HSP10)
MSWKPLNETYFVRIEEVKGISHLIPEHLKSSMVELRTGIVVAAGTGTLLESGIRVGLQANVDDRILFGGKVGHEIEVDGEKLLLIAEANVLAVEE